jgi:transposase
MAGRTLAVVNVREIIRRIREAETDSAIGRDLSVNRHTVSKYRELAEQHGLLKGDLPDMKAIDGLLKDKSLIIPRPNQVSKAAPFHQTIEDLLVKNCTAQVIFERLRSNHDFDGSYDSVKRYVRGIKRKNPEAFIRMEVDPGQEAQVDFGACGLMYDPVEKRFRKSWCFVMVLSYSRHMFVKFVFDQKIPTWLQLHTEAFEFFGGVPRLVVIDNLKAGIIRACLYDPEVQRSYQEYAEDHGFLISPCRPGKANHKGKVEGGGVKYVKNNHMPGKNLPDINAWNEDVLKWCMEKGRRIHGTTKKVPLELFEKIEKAALLPLPAEPYEICWWNRAKLHPDCHIVFEGSYYSAPSRLIRQQLHAKISKEFVRIYHEYEQVAMHYRAGRKGTRMTSKEHLPPDKLHYCMQTPVWCRQKAREIGENTGELVEEMFRTKGLDKLRTVQGILRLEKKYGTKRLESACRRALFYSDTKYATIKGILDKELDKETIPEEAVRPKFKSAKYARCTVGGLFDDESANATA